MNLSLVNKLIVFEDLEVRIKPKLYVGGILTPCVPGIQVDKFAHFPNAKSANFCTIAEVTDKDIYFLTCMRRVYFIFLFVTIIFIYL